MLRKRVYDFIMDIQFKRHMVSEPPLSPHEVSTFAQMVSYYVLRSCNYPNTTKLSHQVCRDLNILSDWFEFKVFLDASDYCLTKLWRSICLTLKEVRLDRAPETLRDIFFNNSLEASRKFDVDGNDILWVIEQLNFADLSRVQRASDELHLEMRSETNIANILKGLKYYIKNFINTHLRFLLNYDPSLEFEDFEHDLLAEGLRVLRHYSYLDNELQLTNYAKKNIMRRGMNIITQRNMQSRQRVRQVVSKCTACKGKGFLPDSVNQNCKSCKGTGESVLSARNFEATTISFQEFAHPLPSYDNAVDSDVEEIQETALLLEAARDAGDKYETFVRIIIGEWYPEFYDYVQREFDVRYNDISFKKLPKYAAQFCGLKRDDLQRVFFDHLPDLDIERFFAKIFEGEQEDQSDVQIASSCGLVGHWGRDTVSDLKASRHYQSFKRSHSKAK